MDLEYLVVDSYAVKSIVNDVDGKSMDESRTRLLAFIGTFYLFIKNNIQQKRTGKSISKLMLHFDSNPFLEFNKKVQRVIRISKNKYYISQTMQLF